MGNILRQDSANFSLFLIGTVQSDPRGLVSRHRRVVHLGGWEHLVAWEDSPGLWPDLADLQPRRLLLDEADRLPDY